MSSENPFDLIAREYDEKFTFSLTGAGQRSIVHDYLKKKVSAGFNILEINCGTGEDAFFLTRLGCKVIATDSSSLMIRRAIEKKVRSGVGEVQFRQAAFNEIGTLFSTKTFDLVFSNFSGLNCVGPDDLRQTANMIHKVIKPGGSLIIVMFGRKCLWEKAYYFWKGKKTEMSRRQKHRSVYVNLGGALLKVFYYSEKEVETIFSSYFRLVNKKPVGLIIPPGYLEKFFEKKRFLFGILMVFEKIIGRFSSLASYSDHYIMEFTTK